MLKKIKRHTRSQILEPLLWRQKTLPAETGESTFSVAIYRMLELMRLYVYGVNVINCIQSGLLFENCKPLL